MSDDEKDGHLQIGIVMGELRAGVERLQRASEQNSAQNVHLLSVTETLVTQMIGVKDRLDLLETHRPRMGSITTEHMVAKVVDEANKAQSESIRVTALAAAEPVLLATEKQTAVVTSGIEHQTKTLTRANTVGMVVMGVILGALQLLQHFFQH